MNRRDMIKGALASAILPSALDTEVKKTYTTRWLPKPSTIATHLVSGVMISGAHAVMVYVDACDVNGNVIRRVQETEYICELADGQVQWNVQND